MLRESFAKAGLGLLLLVASVGVMLTGCDIFGGNSDTLQEGAKTVTVEIKVVNDKTGDPIIEAVIKVNSATAGNTDSQGIYTAEFFPDIHEIEASKDGYNSVAKSVEVEAQKEEIFVTIALIPTVTSVEINPEVSSIEVGGAVTLTAAVTYNGGATDSDVIWSSSDELVATVTASSDAVVTGVASGSVTITATSNTDTGKSASVGITVVESILTPTPTPTPTPSPTPSPATSIVLGSGDSQSGAVGTTLSSPFVVIVEDAGANPVSGVSVTFAITSGNGSLSVTIATTGTDGKASTVLTLGLTAGANTVTATSTGLSGSPVTFSATGLAGSASSIAIDSGDGQSGAVGTTLSSPFVVIVKDVNGNPVNGVGVTFAVTVGGGSLSFTSTTTGADGKASTVLTLGATQGTNTVTATSTGLSGSPVTFNVTGASVTSVSVAPTSAGMGIEVQ